MKKYTLFIFLLLAFAVAGCKKYAEAPLVKNAAYLRVFNDIPNTVDPLHTGQVSPFLTFIMDPQIGNSGAADTGAIVGDYLGTRELYSLSYPINEANNTIGHTTLDAQDRVSHVDLKPINFEYPGNAHVLTAPPINGFDLSAWAAVPAGKHRIMFVVRPHSDVPYTQLAVSIRQQVLIDTIVDFQPGEVYTMEAVSRDLDNGLYGMYLRRESFPHQSFEENKLYVGFVNLSGTTPKIAQYGFTRVFSEKTSVFYTYNIYNDVINQNGANIVYDPLPGYNKSFYTTLATRMDTVIPWLPLPMLPTSSFFRQDTLRTYMTRVPDATFYNGLGSLPHVLFDLRDATGKGEDFSIRAVGNPRTFNQYDLDATTIRNYVPNLNLLVNTGSKWSVHATVNIMEMVYDRVYMMQIQRGFNEMPKN